MKELFKRNGLSQSHFARKLGISRGYLCDMLGDRRPLKKEAELRAHLRNVAADINNYLEKNI